MIRESELPRRGMSNFASWVPELPYNVSPMDVDFLLHDANGAKGPRFLVMEFKRLLPLSVGQGWALKNLARRAGVEVVLVDETRFDVGLIGCAFPPKFEVWTPLSPQDLGEAVRRWLCDKERIEHAIDSITRKIEAGS